jgi:hypothetical protein
VTTSYPVGRRIQRVGGLLESVQAQPRIEGYTAILQFDDSSVVLLAQSDFVPIESWPTEDVPLPIQFIDGPERVEGDIVTSLFRTRSSGGSSPQLFFLLETMRIMGLVNSQRGSVLHIESAFTAPILHGNPELWAIDGSGLTLDTLLSL